jgi:hypothetical protein
MTESKTAKRIVKEKKHRYFLYMMLKTIFGIN